MDIKAAVTHSQGEAFKLEKVKLAAPESDEIRVRIVAAGVCHTDVVARDLGIAPFHFRLYSVMKALVWWMRSVQACLICKSVTMW